MSRDIRYCYICNKPTPNMWWCTGRGKTKCEREGGNLLAKYDLRKYPPRETPDAPFHPRYPRIPKHLQMDEGL